MLTQANKYTNGVKKRHDLGVTINKIRIIPYKPIFNNNPANNTDPSVDASTCASGSQT